MPRLTNLSFEHKRSRYSLAFDLDDAAIMDGELSVDLTAKVVDRHGREFEEVLTVVMDFGAWKAKVQRGGITLHEFDLRRLGKLQAPWDEDGPDGPTPGRDAFGEHVDQGLAGAIEEMLGSIPVPDPIFGCLIKAGVSAVIGQALRCNQKVTAKSAGRRVRAIARCLIDSAGGIFSRAAWRAARCMVTLGLG